jgi:hypothetical protein
MSTPAGLPCRVITTSCFSAIRSSLERSSLSSDSTTFFRFFRRIRGLIPELIRRNSRCNGGLPSDASLVFYSLKSTGCLFSCFRIDKLPEAYAMYGGPGAKSRYFSPTAALSLVGTLPLLRKHEKWQPVIFLLVTHEFCGGALFHCGSPASRSHASTSATNHLTTDPTGLGGCLIKRHLLCELRAHRCKQ